MCAFHASASRNGSTSSNSATKAAPNNGKPVIHNGNGKPALLKGFKAGGPKPVVQERRVLKILEMIQSEPFWRIEDLAREFNLSHSRLEHLFKQQTGVSLGQLLTERRLCRAAHLLVHTNMRVKEIAHTVGYEHTSSFIRAFERHFMQAPLLYRQEPSTPRIKG